MIRSMRRIGLLVGLGVVLCCALVTAPPQPHGGPVPGSVPPNAPQAKDPVVATPSVSPGLATEDAPVTGMLALPDGSRIQALNGVTAPAALVWGEAPWSAIVGTERSDGIDWFVHEDGTYSTTVEVYRSDLGRTDPVTLVSRAGTPVPVEGVVTPKKRTGSPPSRR